MEVVNWRVMTYWNIQSYVVTQLCQYLVMSSAFQFLFNFSLLLYFKQEILKNSFDFLSTLYDQIMQNHLHVSSLQLRPYLEKKSIKSNTIILRF